MELRDIELLDNRIRIAFQENEGRGCQVHLGRNDTILILGLLSGEIWKRRQEVPVKEMKGTSYEELMKQRGQK